MIWRERPFDEWIHPDVPFDATSERAVLTYVERVVAHIRAKAERGETVTTAEVLWLCDAFDKERHFHRLAGRLIGFTAMGSAV